MKAIHRIFVIFPIIFLMLGQLTFAQTAEELLPLAIQLEEVNGELENAIEVYKAIIEKYPDNKPVAAKAYFHMGLCYEKLGKQEAQNAYRMVLSNYADQDEMVKNARARLAALSPPSPEGTKNGMVVKKIWEGSEVDMMGEPSPDGKYISYVDWVSGDLAIYEVATGKKRRITSSGTWEDPNQFAEYSCWSPDSKFLVYDWYHDDNPTWINLYIIGVDDPEPRLLWSDDEIEWAQVYDWSPDGKHILAFLGNKDKTKSINLIQISDGETRILKKFEERSGAIWPQEMKFSPRGDYIAYDIGQEDTSPQRDIFLLAIDGSVDTRLVKHPSNDIFLGWLPDGERVLFASDRNGAMGVWSLQFQNGMPGGEPISVKPNIGPIQSMGFTSGGSYYYGIMSLMNNVDIIELDPGTGKIEKHLEKAIRRFEGNNQTPAYSRDGEYLAYVRRFPMAPVLSVLPGGNILCVKNLETGIEREFRTSLNRFGWPKWSPDGKSVLVIAWDANDQMSYVRIDVQTGLETTVVETRKNISLFGGHDWSPDGNTIYYGQNDQKAKSWNIVSLELDSGNEKVIYQSKEFYNHALSPDGQWLGLCFIDGGKEKNAHADIVSVSDGESREVCSLDENFIFARSGSITWTVDGKYLLLAVSELISGNRDWELCRLPSKGGDLEKLGLKVKYGFLSLNAHPDGRHFVYSSMGDRSTEIWMMENFLPEPEGE